jgi:hypothetical protein
MAPKVPLVQIKQKTKKSRVMAAMVPSASPMKIFQGVEY